ncbi:dienelactone hydrolase family protein [Sphingomonas xanthus]|uniref:Dienelactone hydrolase family protein n=1 Tax=Sphingomonas xanthus TaxID=2594473 RepID=A0A516IPJ2_9SPHN|nr:dienelactone hydrolase family protein [Sphingomonas xanthus]QDP18843.1 dienelactone hydrolase family protein [Sphingomonas xanthus]
MNPNSLQQAIDLYDRFTHEGMDRRDFFARMTLIAGSATAASVLISAIAASPAAAAIVPADDKRLTTREMTFDKPAGYKAYVAEPLSRSPKASVLVIHENRGLTEHIRDVARRAALAGYRAVAVDFLSPGGGTPTNEDAAREAIGKLDLGRSTADAVTILQQLATSSRGGKVGAVGFCWGGAFVNRLAVAAGSDLDAGVVYYGPAPDPSEATRVVAPLLIHHAGLDERVARTLFPWVDALRAADKPVTYQGYDGANHAFNNDTSAERFDKEAADLAWGRTLRFFKRHLG